MISLSVLDREQVSDPDISGAELFLRVQVLFEARFTSVYGIVEDVWFIPNCDAEQNDLEICNHYIKPTEKISLPVRQPPISDDNTHLRNNNWTTQMGVCYNYSH